MKQPTEKGGEGGMHCCFLIFGHSTQETGSFDQGTKGLTHSCVQSDHKIPLLFIFKGSRKIKCYYTKAKILVIRNLNAVCNVIVRAKDMLCNCGATFD